MFTGIITHQVTILKQDNGLFTIQKPIDLLVHVWQSISHDGACMSITQYDASTYSFFAMEESLRKTNFWSKQPWDTFNLECCVQTSSMLDGHIVSGHIDTTGTIIEKQYAADHSMMIRISYDRIRDNNVIPKGSIAINGISLTIVDKGEGWCSIRLIPLTLEKTNLGSIAVGDLVNIEFDMIGKYILNALQHTIPTS